MNVLERIESQLIEVNNQMNVLQNQVDTLRVLLALCGCFLTICAFMHIYRSFRRFGND